MLPEPPQAPCEPPLDALHAVALATGAPMAYLSWPEGRCLWSTTAYAQLFDMAACGLRNALLTNYLHSGSLHE